jgi:hypothetical protein
MTLSPFGLLILHLTSVKNAGPEPSGWTFLNEKTEHELHTDY